MPMLDTLPRTYSLEDRDLIFSEPQDGYVLRVRDMPDDMRPRERLIELGPTNLSVAELVAIIWGVGNRTEDVLAMARRTLKEYGEKAISSELNPQRLAEAADIPLTKACQIVAGFELGRRFYANQAGRSVQVRNAKQAFQYLKDMSTSQKEQLRGLYLNSRYQVVHDEIISIGSLTSNIVHPREVFQPAIERGAVAIILAHNHPSGRLEPTIPDISITEQLVKAGDVLGIELLDHLIIAAGRYTSVMECIDRENGQL
ncbi:MAG TPA: DNA repair protein RadC [Candidatus Dormibacteraeota bacterium]|nr:DNA repair protein RadC [Candidatus Dormibacteraeota bacterium]